MGLQKKWIFLAPHNPSRNAGSAWLIPLHSGTRHLGRATHAAITGFHKACSVSVRGRDGRGLWPRTWSSRYRNAVGTTHGRRAGDLPRRKRKPVLTRPGSLRRVGQTRPLAPDWVARDRREKSGRAGRYYRDLPRGGGGQAPAGRCRSTGASAASISSCAAGDPVIDARSPQCGLTQLVEAVPPRRAFMFAENRR